MTRLVFMPISGGVLILPLVRSAEKRGSRQYPARGPFERQRRTSPWQPTSREIEAFIIVEIMPHGGSSQQERDVQPRGPAACASDPGQYRSVAE